MYSSHVNDISLPSITVSTGTFPHNFIAKLVCTKYGVEYDLEIMACCWVAVQIDAPCRLEDSVKLNESSSHHHKVSHHLISTDKIMERLNHFGDMVRGFCEQFCIGMLCF